MEVVIAFVGVALGALLALIMELWKQRQDGRIAAQLIVGQLIVNSNVLKAAPADFKGLLTLRATAWDGYGPALLRVPKAQPMLSELIAVHDRVLDIRESAARLLQAQTDYTNAKRASDVTMRAFYGSALDLIDEDIKRFARVCESQDARRLDAAAESLTRIAQRSAWWTRLVAAVKR